jgi:hypothetical protein
MTPTVEIMRASIRVKYDGMLHFCCKKADLLAVNSWKWNEASGEPHARFCIEYTFAGASVVCEYDTESHWEAILIGLDKIL